MMFKYVIIIELIAQQVLVRCKDLKYVFNNDTRRWGLESCQGLWILSCEEAIQVAYGTSKLEQFLPLSQCFQSSNRVTALAWNNARRGTQGLPPTVNFESCHIIFTVLVPFKTQPKITEKKHTISFWCKKYFKIQASITLERNRILVQILYLFVFNVLYWYLYKKWFSSKQSFE